ncbi:MAG: anthranilate synthase component I family protein [Agromyces sp.]
MHSRDALALAADRLAREPGSLAWLDAGPEAAVGRSYLIVPAELEHRLSANVQRQRVRESHGAIDTWHDGSIFSVLRERWHPEHGSGAAARFSGGWVGWFGYECAADTLGIAMRTEGPEFLDAAWFAAGAWATLEHETGTVRIDGDDRRARARLESALAADSPADPGPRESSPSVRHARWRDTPAQYAAHVRAAQRHIADGEAYQLCLTSRVSGSETLDAMGVYQALRARVPSHHGSFIRIGETAIASASPEQFLELSPEGRLRTKPIKGTRPRSHDPAADDALARELRESEKERAENVMIVDLMRNDLGRVAVTGSVWVPELLRVERYAPVHQLVSTVEAQLAPDRHPIDAIVAAFPAGSMTGAPKHRAVLRLQGIESGPRGVYSGAHGYLSLDGSLDLAMTIRSIVVRPDGWTIGAGGGITALSIAEEEVAEAQLKAAALLAAIGVENAD